ncbi:MAG TPA: translation elongation factor Ts [SAR86 cluster bacterium]|jgi:elongation factor Ts|nr:translation elongation factor Ts [SAR86 cluster bacterium]HJM15162.1 translation elongation factor Ts [SAR86 cluster bacterium]|tara:strand:+ start:2411 stop:3271 length:861 start_codon:yes stop_codon:yes gene_type:complete
MSNISASQVKELREKTGLGLMDCKKALEEANGDLDLAVEELRKTSGLKASKKSSRSAADGLIGIKSFDGKSFMVEINCETDFVARDDSFNLFMQEVLEIVSTNGDKSLEELLKSGIEEKREKLVQKLGENIVVRRATASVDNSDSSGVYLHSNNKIGTIISLKGGTEEVAKDIAMHAAATDPMAISPSDIPEDVIEKEREIYKAQSEESGKPADIVEKIIEGKIRKFLSEVSLTEQDFVKDPGLRINDILKDNDASIIGFTRFEVGEGIEVEKVDFASEVMSQIEG